MKYTDLENTILSTKLKYQGFRWNTSVCLFKKRCTEIIYITVYSRKKIVTKPFVTDTSSATAVKLYKGKLYLGEIVTVNKPHAGQKTVDCTASKQYHFCVH